ncbi:MAG: dihydroorotase [PVC group bacterium]|nr:dihydroorotase [PVC group bacterium]
MSLLIKNGRVVDAKNKQDGVFDILVEGAKISKIAKNIVSKDDNVFDAKGMLVVPGLIDLHVHLREPGYEYKETILSGSQAAARGGFTSICCMPNTNPVIDNQGVVDFVFAESKKAGLVNVFPVGAITKGLKGEDLADIADMKESGVVALSDDGYEVASAALLRMAMEYASMFDLPIIAHCEDKELSSGGVMNEGYMSTVLGLKGIPRVAEITMVSRDIELARFTGTKLHIAHVSCKESVALIKKAKKEGVKVTSECCPHHFSLTEEAVEQYDTNTKVNPPLRTKEDVEAIKKGLKDGTIDCIATDHAPHSISEKDTEYDLAPFGIIGSETALGLVMTELVDKGILSIEQVVEKMALNPARVIGQDKGYLSEGGCADITIIDPKQEWVVEKDGFVSKSSNSPFIGKTLTGQVMATIVSGKIVFEKS